MSNFLLVKFPSANVEPKRASAITFWQERNKHEFGVIEFRDWDVNYDDVKPGTPIKFSLSSGEGYREFSGYIHHITPSVTPGKRSTSIHFIGASYYLKQKSQVVYKNTTASEIVKKIARKHNFAYQVEDHPRVYPQIAQAGLTDVEMLNKLAKQCGYSLRLTNAEIYFQPVTKLYEEQRENAPIFYLRDAQDPLGSTLYSFNPLIGESLEHEGEYKSASAVGGVDKYTAKIIQLTNQKRPKSTRKKTEVEFFDHFMTGTVINDYSAAKSESESVDQRNRFPYRATAEVLGNPNVGPDMPVYIDGAGEAYSGYWIVLGAEHKVVSSSYNTQVYTTILTLGTDSLGSAVVGADNKMVKSPNVKPKRTIIPGVRQTNVKPKTTLSTGTKHPTKQKPVGFGNISNRAKPKIAKQTIIPTKWKSTNGNLKKVTKTTGRSSTVVNKLRRSGVL